MPLIVDTYNVLHVTGVLPPDLAGIGLAGLAELIGDSRYASEEVCLVCDGTSPPGTDDEDEVAAGDAAVHFLFSGPRRSADEVIERMIDRSTSPRRLTVVSSDRRVIQAARKRRCRTLRADDFLAQLARDHRQRSRRGRRMHKPRAPLTHAEVEQWIREFGLTEQDLD